MKKQLVALSIRTLATAAMVVSVGALGFWYFLTNERAVPTASAQSDMYLSRRIDQVEQRFYSIESRINRLESQVVRPSITAPSLSATNETEMEFLRTQISSLRTRLGEAECALLKLDERTLSANARTARARSAAGTDACRQDPATPVRLSVRP